MGPEKIGVSLWENPAAAVTLGLYFHFRTWDAEKKIPNQKVGKSHEIHEKSRIKSTQIPFFSTDIHRI